MRFDQLAGVHHRLLQVVMGVDHPLLAPAQYHQLRFQPEQLGAEASVTPTGAETDQRCLEHQYPGPGVVALELPGRVQPGKATADHCNIDTQVLAQGRVR
ncbi:hypothetical protein D3C78_1152210 [compost metagenome]